MIKPYLLFVCMLSSLFISAQTTVYSNLKDLLSNQGIAKSGVFVEKRTRNKIVLNGGADFKVSSDDDKAINHYLKKRCYAIRIDSNLYVNCKRLHYKKMRFGNWYAPALIIAGNVYFSAVPLGSVVAQSSRTMKVKLGGELGDAIASSGLVGKRVYYKIDGDTGQLSFASKACMFDLLESQPQLLRSYLEEDSESAEVIGKYLQLLQNIE